jgi:hypothetical protein
MGLASHFSTLKVGDTDFKTLDLAKRPTTSQFVAGFYHITQVRQQPRSPSLKYKNAKKGWLLMTDEKDLAPCQTGRVNIRVFMKTKSTITSKGRASKTRLLQQVHPSGRD